MSFCKPNIYVENISNVVYTEGVVRLELTTRSLSTMSSMDSQGDLSNVAEPVGVLVMSLPALLRVSEQLEKTMADMHEKGLLSKRETPQEPKNSDL
jgi:hypothetical protein